ncbi:MAG: hypothetical protein LBV47_03015 [Bacteroidales bacterium]|jgi:hypothetical protein|nr:hypothetical protein [Bacteroidales bacterium]
MKLIRIKLRNMITIAICLAAVILSGCGEDNEPPIPVIRITIQPTAPAEPAEGGIAPDAKMSVTAKVTEDATVTYQWYTNTAANNTGGTVISGVTSPSYTLPADLAEGTYYYFCELSAVGAETVRTICVTVTVMKKIEPPTLTTDEAVIGHYSIELGGSIAYEGNPPYIERGVCYSTLPNPTVNNDKVLWEVSTETAFSIPVYIKGFRPETRYYARTYAAYKTYTGVSGVAYGNEISFIAPAPSVPETHSIYAVASSPSLIHIAWTSATDIDGLSIEYSPNGVSEWIEIAKVSESNFFKHAGVAAGTTHYYRARAYN